MSDDRKIQVRASFYAAASEAAARLHISTAALVTVATVEYLHRLGINTTSTPTDVTPAKPYAPSATATRETVMNPEGAVWTPYEQTEDGTWVDEEGISEAGELIRWQ